jgi:hypothetical protein
MNNTLLNADLATHLKIVAVAMAATIVAGPVEVGTQTTPAGSKPVFQAADHNVESRQLKRVASAPTGSPSAGAAQ